MRRGFSYSVWGQRLQRSHSHTCPWDETASSQYGTMWTMWTMVLYSSLFPSVKKGEERIVERSSTSSTSSHPPPKSASMHATAFTIQVRRARPPQDSRRLRERAGSTSRRRCLAELIEGLGLRWHHLIDFVVAPGDLEKADSGGLSPLGSPIGRLWRSRAERTAD